MKTSGSGQWACLDSAPPAEKRPKHRKEESRARYQQDDATDHHPRRERDWDEGPEASELPRDGAEDSHSTRRGKQRLEQHYQFFLVNNSKNERRGSRLTLELTRPAHEAFNIIAGDKHHSDAVAGSG